ncbi:hypothetical protein MAH1_27540 [Sessilibacter sp. MAH1]
MSNIKRYSLDEIEKMESKSDKKKFIETTDKEILEQIIADPDTPKLTKEELKELKLAKERKK